MPVTALLSIAALVGPQRCCMGQSSPMPPSAPACPAASSAQVIHTPFIYTFVKLILKASIAG